MKLTKLQQALMNLIDWTRSGFSAHGARLTALEQGGAGGAGVRFGTFVESQAELDTIQPNAPVDQPIYNLGTGEVWVCTAGVWSIDPAQSTASLGVNILLANPMTNKMFAVKDPTTMIAFSGNSVVVTTPPSGGGSGGTGGGGCVAVASFLPDNRTAGDVAAGDSMILADQYTLAPGVGTVSYSETKEQPGYRIVTESGVSLVCSDTAPIPVLEGDLKTPDQLLGEFVAVRRDVGDSFTVGWEKVVEVSSVGIILVQHITVGDMCFWAGEVMGAYILHHNVKAAP